MLAGPKRRKSYVLTPRGKPLYEDENHFGVKLMQKMGWSKGSGLGRNEQGSSDFIRPRYKNDTKGFGFAARDDQWTQHEQNFSGLLSALNGNEGENDSLNKGKQVVSDESENEAPRLGFGFQHTTAEEGIKANRENVKKLKEKISGISLEEKSKKSRARVHYQKFTRGKDLSQYSEKDLANIFGKKVGEESSNSSIQQEGVHNSNHLSTGISVSEYFKMKMQAKRNQMGNVSKTDLTESNEDIKTNSATDEHQQSEQVSKKKKKKVKVAEETENFENETANKREEESKKAKRLDLEHESSAQKENTSSSLEILETQEQKPKKKKKSKHKTREHLQPEDEQLEQKPKANATENKGKEENFEVEGKHSKDTIEIEEPPKKKLKKSKKRKDDTKDDEQKSTETEIVNVEEKLKLLENHRNKNSPAEQKESCEIPVEQSEINKTNEVSCKTKEELPKDDEIYNIFSISSFCAEKFRNLDLNSFECSSQSQIKGYGISEDIKLEVYVDEHDEEHITNLWKGVLDTHLHLQKPKRTYSDYIKEVRKAHSMKQKRPKLNVKTWKRKNAFQII